MDATTSVVADSAFGCAGQRCLAVSVAVTVAESQTTFRDSAARTAAGLRVGSGLDEHNQIGPVISAESKQRVETLIGQGAKEGGRITVDGRNPRVAAKGNFVGPTVIDDLPPSSSLMSTEIFGPVLSLVHAGTLDDALAILGRSAYGNAASIFTSSGAAARKFRYEAPAGNIGVNIGVAAPMAFFPFVGWKRSFLGDLHATGADGVRFYTKPKVVTTRWFLPPTLDHSLPEGRGH